MEIPHLTAVSIVTGIANGTLSSLEVAECLLRRADACSGLNTLINFDPSRFLEAAEAADQKLAAGSAVGPLHGLPLVIKDNIDVAGYPTTAATPALKNHEPGQTAPVMRKLLDAGAIVMSKANMHEMAFSPGVSQPEDGREAVWGAFGTARNPYDPDRSPAGSSSGTGAAVAARIAPAGLGTDTGGSVRNPAAWCGIVGLRPTTGRYSQRGIVPISWTRDTAGPMARNVADLELLDRVICSTDAVPPADLSRLRFGVERRFFCSDCDPDILALFEAEVERLASAGAEIVDVAIPGLDLLMGTSAQHLAAYEFSRAVPKYLADTGAGVSFEDVISQIAASGLGERLTALGSTDAISDTAYQEALNDMRPALQAAYSESFETAGLDALIFPSTIIAATRLDDWGTHTMGGREVPKFLASSRNVQPASIGGFAGLTVPMGLTPKGLPAAIGFDGPRGNDRNLLAIGLAYETLRPEIPAPPL